jgi:diguanylate cyclase (GGDEF)-like protein
LYFVFDVLGEINQLHGRKAGDQVIRAVAAALSKSCRLEDFIWHHGEDEFVVLLSETDASGAKEVAQRLTTQILSATKYVEVATKVSASIGYSTYPNHSDTVTGLVANARSALYLAKALGKGIAREAMTDDFPKAEKAEVKQEEAGQVEVEQVEVEQAAAHATTSKPAIPQRPEDLASFDTPVKSTEETAKKPAEITAMQTATVLIASTSPLLMAGMKQVLSKGGTREKSEEGARENGISLAVVREINSPEILAEAVTDTRPDLIFTDLQMATAKGFAVAKLLETENLPCKLAVYISDVSPDVLKLAADFSVDGIIMQNTPPADIAKALGEIYKGKTVFPEEVQSSLSELKDNRRLLSDLSEREIEVLKLVAEGKSNSQISKELYVTVNTVRFHLANIYQKLGVTNRTEATNYYLRQNLPLNGQPKLL